ncbi:hypothetical protein BGZ83_008989 [Gryganskiella cystojenkinii]|nr:hypothetical protein BGZ83_008989 [Gryganskiella cystojenkinii]
MRTNFVTHLTLYREQAYGGDLIPIGPTLHQFLCAAPLLESLEARFIQFAVEDLDIYGQFFRQVPAPTPTRHETAKDDATGPSMAATGATNWVNKPKDVWVCNRLQRLCLGFYSRTIARKELASDRAKLQDDPVIARLIFGYLTRFTPSLTYVEIQVGARDMNMCRGFPILSRFQKIQKMCIYLLAEVPVQTSEVELKWIKVGGLASLSEVRPSMRSTFSEKTISHEETTSRTRTPAVLATAKVTKNGSTFTQHEPGCVLSGKWSWGERELVGDHGDDREFVFVPYSTTTMIRTTDLAHSSATITTWNPDWARIGTLEDMTAAVDEIRLFDQEMILKHSQQNLKQEQQQKRPSPPSKKTSRWFGSQSLKPVPVQPIGLRWPNLKGVCIIDVDNRVPLLPHKVQDLAGLTRWKNQFRFF